MKENKLIKSLENVLDEKRRWATDPLKMELEKLDSNDNTIVGYDGCTKEYYWEDYKNDTFGSRFKTEKEAYESLISHLNSFSKGGIKIK